MPFLCLILFVSFVSHNALENCSYARIYRTLLFCKAEVVLILRMLFQYIITQCLCYALHCLALLCFAVITILYRRTEEKIDRQTDRQTDR
jgi:hypothetical protein